MTLSVALCTFNGEAYLAAQLESLAAQTSPPFEVVVSDDGSTDRTVAIIEGFAARAPFPVRLHRNARQLGVAKNFERAIELCAGELIALADQDDIWRPIKIERVRAAMAAPGIGLVFSNADLVDDRSRPLNRRLWDITGVTRARRTLRHPTRTLRLLVPGWTVTGATMAFRAALRSVALPIPTDLAMIHDGWIALVASAVARIHVIDEPLILYRQHATQQIGARPKVRDTASVRAALRRPGSHADALRTAATLRERLNSAGVPVEPAVLNELDALIAHFDARRQLPATCLRRLPVVARELLALHYHQYGRGFKSATKDLVSGSIASR